MNNTDHPSPVGSYRTRPKTPQLIVPIRAIRPSARYARPEAARAFGNLFNSDVSLEVNRVWRSGDKARRRWHKSDGRANQA